MNTIALFKESDVPINLDCIAENLNKICISIAFKEGKSSFTIKDRLVKSPESYSKLSKAVKSETKSNWLSFFATNKQYYNNYFFESLGNRIILSFYGWDYLTRLSRNNGLLLFIADFLALEIDNTYRHQDTTGCIYDFLWDKTGIDDGMRKSFICPKCLTRIGTKKLTRVQKGVLGDLRAILNVLAAASKWELDVVEYWKQDASTPYSHKRPILNTQIFPQLDFIPEQDDKGYINVSRKFINDLCKLYLELTDSQLLASKNGKVLEQFAQHFFGLIKGWEIIECNANLKDCELDIIFDITAGPAILRSKLGDSVYVECENRKEKSDVRDISHFAWNLKSRGLKSGILFSYNGITGYSADNWRNVDAAYKRIIDVCRQEKIYVLPMVSQDIELVRNGGNLVKHILELLNRFIRI